MKYFQLRQHDLVLQNSQGLRFRVHSAGLIVDGPPGERVALASLDGSGGWHPPGSVPRSDVTFIGRPVVDGDTILNTRTGVLRGPLSVLDLQMIGNEGGLSAEWIHAASVAIDRTFVPGQRAKAAPTPHHHILKWDVTQGAKGLYVCTGCLLVVTEVIGGYDATRNTMADVNQVLRDENTTLLVENAHLRRRLEAARKK